MDGYKGKTMYYLSEITDCVTEIVVKRAVVHKKDDPYGTSIVSTNNVVYGLFELFFTNPKPKKI